MYAKGFLSFLVPVMIIACSGCDNVEFEGVQVELRPPPARPNSAVEPVAVDSSGAPAPLPPLELESPVLYLVERGTGSEATLLAVALMGAEGYTPLPDFSEDPVLVERFALGQLEEGREFALYSHGMQVGTFVAEGGAREDESTCRIRPVGSGRIELRPDLSATRTFLALPRDEIAEGTGGRGADSASPLPPLPSIAETEAASIVVAQIAFQEMGVPWPPSIPEARRAITPLALEGGTLPAFAATFLYAGDLEIGEEASVAYSLFLVAAQGETRYEPVAGWYQRDGADEKASPRMLAAHDLAGSGSPDLLLEVFGDDRRWLALFGAREEGWSMLYQDPCGVPAARGGIETFR